MELDQKTSHRIFKLIKQNRFTAEQVAALARVTVGDVIKVANKRNLKVDIIITGNDKQLDWLRKNIIERKHCLLYGDFGIGKTSGVYMVARELGFDVIYLNASMLRTASSIATHIQLGYRTKSNIVYLMDEADNIYWTGYRTIAKLLKESRNPIILTANDASRIPDSIKKHKNIDVIPFGKPTLPQVMEFCKEKYKFLFLPPREDGEKFVRNLYYRHSGDVRGIVIDIVYEMETGRIPEKKQLSAKQFANLALFFKNRTKVLMEYENLKDPYAWVFGWLFENGDPVNFAKLMEISRWKYNTKQKYVIGMVANLQQQRISRLHFPRAYKKPPKPEDKKKMKLERITKKVVEATLDRYMKSAGDPFDF